MVRRLFDAMGKPELGEDPRFANHAARIAHRHELDDEIEAFLKTRDRAASLDLFDKAGVTVGPVMDAGDLLEDEFMRLRGALVDQPDTELGTIPAPGAPIRFGNAPTRDMRSAPKIGEHTQEILKELGVEPPAQGEAE